MGTGTEGLMRDTLFDLHNPELDPDAAEIFARARTTDPETSHQAARSVDPGRIREMRQQVLVLFRVLGPMTQRKLVEQYQARYDKDASDSSIRTRCHELVEGGHVKDTGRKERLPSGRCAVVWAAKEGGR